MINFGKREMKKNSKIFETNIYIFILLRANDMVSFSPAGVHSDPRYYPNPDTFNPDNFSKEARHQRSP